MRRFDERSEVFSELAESILVGGSYKATKILGEQLTVKACRRRFRAYGGKVRKGHRVEILFTVGKPNFAERCLIRKAKRMGMKFPIKKILEKFQK
jgi:hypothetical protein